MLAALVLKLPFNVTVAPTAADAGEKDDMDDCAIPYSIIKLLITNRQYFFVCVKRHVISLTA